MTTSTGYFPSLIAFLYRETTDGHRVVGRRLVPFAPKRWLLVSPSAQPRFERRVKQAHIGGLAAIALGVQFIPYEASLSTIFIAVAVLALVSDLLMQWWFTAGLPAYDGDASTILPVRRLEMHERQARAMGPRGLAAFAVLSLVLAIPQAIVAVQDRLWWAWAGFALFAGSAVYFVIMYRRVRAG